MVTMCRAKTDEPIEMLLGVFMQGYVLSGGRILQGKRQFWGIGTSPDRRCKNVQIKIKKHVKKRDKKNKKIVCKRNKNVLAYLFLV